MHKISLPLRVKVSKNKYFSLNLNEYRNAHHHVLNKAKTVFTEEMASLLKGLPKFERTKLKYTLFVPTKRKIDIANVGSIVDKFFSDALTYYGKLPEDNTKHLPEVTYCFGDIDPENPRMEVEFYDYELLASEEENPVRIILTEIEIKEALMSYVLSQLNIKEDQSVDIVFKNTRGDDGATAEINITANTPDVVGNGLPKLSSVLSTPPSTKELKTKTSTTASPVTTVEATDTSKEVTETESVSSASTDTEEKDEEFTPPSFLSGQSDSEPSSTKSLFGNLERVTKENSQL